MVFLWFHLNSKCLTHVECSFALEITLKKSNYIFFCKIRITLLYIHCRILHQLSEKLFVKMLCITILTPLIAVIYSVNQNILHQCFNPSYIDHVDHDFWFSVFLMLWNLGTLHLRRTALPRVSQFLETVKDSLSCCLQVCLICANQPVQIL